MLMNSSVAAATMGSIVGNLNSALGAGAVLQAWDGTPPASISTGDAGSMIVECPCSNPVFAAVSGGVSSANTITDDSDTAAGTVTYWRMKDSGGVVVLQWTEGVDFITDDPNFALHDTCHIVSVDLTLTVTPPDS